MFQDLKLSRQRIQLKNYYTTKFNFEISNLNTMNSSMKHKYEHNIQNKLSSGKRFKSNFM